MTAWDLQPTLVGPGVRLEPLGLHHADGLLAAADDDAVFTWLSVARPADSGDARAIVDRYTSAAELYPFAILTATGEVAGMTCFYDVGETLQTVTIGHTWIGRRHWRTGLNRAAKTALLTHAFGPLGCVRVVWHVDHLNERSQAAMAALGATREGVLRKHKRRRDGSWRDTVVFSMLDTEWTGSLPANRTPPTR